MNSEPFIKIEALSMKYSHVSVAHCTIFSGQMTCAEHRTVSCDCSRFCCLSLVHTFTILPHIHCALLRCASKNASSVFISSVYRTVIIQYVWMHHWNALSYYLSRSNAQRSAKKRTAYVWTAFKCCSRILFTTTTPVERPLIQDNLGKPVPER